MDRYLRKAVYAAACVISVIEVVSPNSIIPPRYDFLAIFILNTFGSGAEMMSVVTLMAGVIFFLNVITVAYAGISRKKHLRELEVEDGTNASKAYIWLLHKTVWMVFYWIVALCGYVFSVMLSPSTSALGSNHGAVYGILAANSLALFLDWTPRLSGRRKSDA